MNALARIGRILVAVLLIGGSQIPMASCAHAQSTGKLRLFCEPQASSMYIVDGKHRLTDREITLMEGPHRFVFWAPERRMLDTTLMVVAGTTREAHLQLHYSDEYIAYRRDADRYTKGYRWQRYGPPIVAIGAGAWAGVSIAHALKARKDLDALEDEYHSSAYPAGISELKDERIPAANKELRDSRTMAYVSSGVFVAAAAITWWTQHRLRHGAAPVFEDKEKVRFDGLVWVPGINNSGTWMAALTLPIR